MTATKQPNCKTAARDAALLTVQSNGDVEPVASSVLDAVVTKG